MPERFVPEEMHGQLVEAEHIARYWWATRFCKGLRVLDAACGSGYGAAMLSLAGAADVVAVDIAEGVIEVARDAVPEGVKCEVADIAALPYGDESFELAVCFEAIEHVPEPDKVLDELARVLVRGGLLLISSPNRARYVPGNPHHLHEYLPEELRAALASRFPAVRLLPQNLMVASVVETDVEPAELIGADVRRLVKPPPEHGIYILAMAGRDLPDPGPPLIALTQFVELRQWLERYEEQADLLRRQKALLDELTTIRADRAQALRLLEERERALADALTTYEEAKRSQDDLAKQLEDDLRRTREDLTRAQRVIEDLKRSTSWRATAPLRAIKHALRLRGSR